MSMERFTDTQTWYVVFDKCYSKHWWKYLLHPQFQHVYMLRAVGDNTIMVNCLSHVTTISHHEVNIEDFLKEAADSTAILALTVYYGAHYKPAPMELLTCVSVVKRALGIRARLITPKALYHEMIKAGAYIIKPFAIIN